MININAGDTVHLYFNTVDADGKAVSPSAALTASDIAIYKDGSAVKKTTTNGITVTSPFGSKVGRHKISIDTSNSTGDVGFWPAGSLYTVSLETTKTSGSVSLDGLIIPDNFGIEYGYMVGTDGANVVVPPSRAEATADKDEILTRGSTGPWTTGGAGAVTITPITSTVSAGTVSDQSVTYYKGEGKDLTITVVDGDGNAIDMTGKTLVMIVENKDKSDYFTIADGSIAKGGAGGNVLTITIPAANITRLGNYRYSIRDSAAEYRVWAKGTLTIEYAPEVG